MSAMYFPISPIAHVIPEWPVVQNNVQVFQNLIFPVFFWSMTCPLLLTISCLLPVYGTLNLSSQFLRFIVKLL